ncbi:hypothetical protein PU02_0391 [Bartonella ancashensis]|uniref:Uncharacterized protein n=1 Tax=Bartonella ancashensis TaxID=1318743 RepID=A0A0M3T2R7_9HYPH|nr:hypothetical protein PU02_0391 [Bartonella ancashensis]
MQKRKIGPCMIMQQLMSYVNAVPICKVVRFYAWIFATLKIDNFIRKNSSIKFGNLAVDCNDARRVMLRREVIHHHLISC